MIRIPATEHRRLANMMIDHLGSLELHVEVWRSASDDDWCELVGIDTCSHESWTVESDDLYIGVCMLADQIGLDLSDG